MEPLNSLKIRGPTNGKWKANAGDGKRKGGKAHQITHATVTGFSEIRSEFGRMLCLKALELSCSTCSADCCAKGVQKESPWAFLTGFPLQGALRQFFKSRCTTRKRQRSPSSSQIELTGGLLIGDAVIGLMGVLRFARTKIRDLVSVLRRGTLNTYQ